MPEEPMELQEETVANKIERPKQNDPNKQFYQTEQLICKFLQR